MTLLIDTHTFIWFVRNDAQLPAKTKKIIETADAVLFSVASVWEMAIKFSLGKLDLQRPFSKVFDDIAQRGIELLHLTQEDFEQVAQLPFHHRDPFDRILIAQAATRRIPIVSRDEAFDAYTIPRLW